MKNELEISNCDINALSLAKLLSISKILKGGIRYGENCYLLSIDTDTDRDIFKHPVRIDVYIFVVCSNGLIELTYNLYNVTLSANTMFLYNPGAILRLNVLEKSQLNMMIFTREFIDELGIKFDRNPLRYKIVRERQVYSVSGQDCQQIRTLMSLTESFVGLDKTNVHYCEMVRSAFKTFMLRALYSMNEQFENTADSDFLATHDKNHFDKFMLLLDENYKRERSIKFYSDRMHLSPKYLSRMIKKVSGKLATEWIDEYVILEAKNLIKYSAMSIQEISYSMNFPNQSFFGKYFKRHTGFTPKEYRAKP